jgi:hypothetical protein
MPLAESELTAGEDLSDEASELVDLLSIAVDVGAAAVGVRFATGVSTTGARNK